MTRIMICAMLAASAITTASAQVPHTFAQGEPARANEVNENFEALDTRIAENATAIEELLAAPSNRRHAITDKNGALVGNVPFQADDEYDGLGIVTEVSIYSSVASLSGPVNIVVHVTPSSAGRSGLTLYYEDSDCNTTPYVRRDSVSDFWIIPGTSNVPDLAEPSLVNSVNGDVYTPISDTPLADSTLSSQRFIGYIDGVYGTACYSYAGGTTYADREYIAVATSDNFYTRYPPPYSLILSE